MVKENLDDRADGDRVVDADNSAEFVIVQYDVAADGIKRDIVQKGFHRAAVKLAFALKDDHFDGLEGDDLSLPIRPVMGNGLIHLDEGDDFGE